MADTLANKLDGLSLDQLAPSSTTTDNATDDSTAHNAGRKFLKIDLHTHILPKHWPNLEKKYGYGGWVQMEHHEPVSRPRVGNASGAYYGTGTSYQFSTPTVCCTMAFRVRRA
ncbi:hypothetical protein BC936DRAFT_144961 [Jimgerdemannia flammicorona]|uniref:Amidohydrolase-related domain-containing protein n=1 Tax=Jimgerdemannia flammicorona TaxID=994334 RepID=A0A433DB91_9FUNG|nr:hypothetical protein BC936DRAFT_144961 [Jimgerdemannia flammicorona]